MAFGPGDLLDAIKHSIYNQPPTDWSKVTNLGVTRAVPEVKEAFRLPVPLKERLTSAPLLRARTR
jgi:hypothetical protein